MSSESKVKMSITINESVALAIKELADGNVSSFINQELTDSVFRHRARGFQEGLDDELGIVPQDAMEWAAQQILDAKAD